MPVRVLVAVAAAIATSSEAVRVLSRSNAAYNAFLKEFGTERPHGNSDNWYHARLSLFEKRSEEVRRHNSQPGITWFAAVNKFADYTEAEFKGLLGHKPTGPRARRVAPGSLVQLQSPQQLEAAVDWSQKLNTSSKAKDQGGCGSCWAVASAGALETHAEIAGGSVEVSYEQMVDCVRNPDECGGTGGCHGATSELALDYVHNHGIAAKADYKGYETGHHGPCIPAVNPVISIQGYVRLPENKLQPLLEALSTKGPVVVSADATPWGMYEKGVFDGCDQDTDTVINHAILAMGYGTDKESKVDYFLIRNSWGADWGENGFIRLKRHSDDGYCGTDKQPDKGVGCKDGPAELPVCGMCGILSDSAYPSDVKLVK